MALKSIATILAASVFASSLFSVSALALECKVQKFCSIDGICETGDMSLELIEVDDDVGSMVMVITLSPSEKQAFLVSPYGDTDSWFMGEAESQPLLLWLDRPKNYFRVIPISDRDEGIAEGMCGEALLQEPEEKE